MAKVKKKSQIEMVLEHLMTGQTITPLDALHNYGCFRLAAVVFKIRDMGINVVSEMITIDDKSFAQYQLADEERNVLLRHPNEIKTANDYLELMGRSGS